MAAEAPALPPLTPALLSAMTRIAKAHGMDLVTYSAETSDRVAEIGARGMADPSSLTVDEIKSVCASVVAQARRA